MEYICFFHPRIKGNDKHDLCGACRREFGYPEWNLPRTVADFDIEGLAGRGFYSVVVSARHRRTGILSVLKLTPQAVYQQADPRNAELGGFGDRRNFLDESNIHRDVSDLAQIVNIVDWGQETVDFGEAAMDICWTQMERAVGTTIETALDSEEAVGPKMIAQIASDLLELSVHLTQRQIFHNDLHAGNAVIERLTPTAYRVRGIDSTIQVKVFDLGSASRNDRSGDGRLNDLEQISRITLQLLQHYESQQSTSSPASDIRLSAQLRRVAQFYARDDLASRRPTANDMLAAIRSAFEISIHPEQQRPLTFQSVGDYYNAQMLPTEFARLLIHDPEGTWTRQLTSSGPQLLVGMRGCGKTMLLRSLEWTAHAVEERGETRKEVADRLSHLAYIGLFASCAYLLRAPRERVGPGATQRLYLAYAREAIRAAMTCEAEGLANVAFEALDAFSELVSNAVPTYLPPEGAVTLSNFEQGLSLAIQREVPDEVRAKFVSLEAFTALAAGIRSLVDAWTNKIVLFLLDDVSKRFVNSDDLEDLLTQFCLKHESFGFKISTETQTQLLLSPSGQPALEGRDYQVFNLGDEVLGLLRGSRGDEFLEQILSRRQFAVSSAMELGPRELLGNLTLVDIAKKIRGAGGANATTYSGLRALAAICVGDIGDVVQIYQRMLQGSDGRTQISAQRQHEVLLAESSSRLLSLVPLDLAGSWFYLHAAAFAQASHRELLVRTDRDRQHGEVYVEISSESPDAFEKLMRLVDNGVYVILGFAQRQKNLGDAPHFQFRLRFRKLLGLRFGMPLSNRDRFEIGPGEEPSWLDSPRSEAFSPAGASETDWVETWIMEAEDDPVAEVPPIALAKSAVSDISVTLEVKDEDRVAFGLATTAFTSRIDKHPLSSDTVDWSAITLVAAVGFEDRAFGSLSKLAEVAQGLVNRVVLLDYPKTGDDHPIKLIARNLSQSVELVPVDASVDPTSTVNTLIAAESGPILVDVTAMTKPLIFATVRAALTSHQKVWILHTAADLYEPTASTLEPVLDKLNAGEYDDGLRMLNLATPGEGSTFEPLIIGQQPIEGSIRTLLALFVTLKHERVDSLLRSLLSDKLVGIRSVHVDDAKDVHSRIIDIITNYVISPTNGELAQVGSMDAQGTFDLLVRYYERFVLDHAFQMDIALTGTKMQSVGAAMFASVARPAGVYYSRPLDRDSSRFTHGTGASALFEIVKVSRHL